MIAGIGQVGSYRFEVLTQLRGIRTRRSQHFFEVADLLFQVFIRLGRGRLCEAFSLLFQVGTCFLRAFIGACQIFAQRLAAAVQLFGCALRHRQELLLGLRQAFFNFIKFFCHGGIHR